MAQTSYQLDCCSHLQRRFTRTFGEVKAARMLDSSIWNKNSKSAPLCGVASQQVSAKISSDADTKARLILRHFRHD